MDVPFDEIIDPHIHLFDVAGTPRPTRPLARLFGWNETVLRTMAKRMFPRSTYDFFGARNHLVTDYLPTDYRTDTSSASVGRYVHVQAGWKDRKPLDCVGETRWLESLDDSPAGIVAYADCHLGPRIGEVLDAHVAASSAMRGIRHMLANHPAPGVMDFTDDDELAENFLFRSGYRRLAEHDLSFDAWCYSHQLFDVADLARAHPEVPLVLCHLGTPVGFGGEFAGVGTSEQERARIGDQWRAGITALAEIDHVHVKISGLLMPCLGFGYEHDDTDPTVSELVDRLGPLVRHAIGAFGPERCMFASNFPVDKVSVSYPTLVAAMLELTDQDGTDAQAEMFAGTAARFYRL